MVLGSRDDAETAGPATPPSLPVGRRARRWLVGACALAWACALTASHVPGPYLPRMGAGDKGLHVAGFLVLTGLFWLTLAAYGRRRLGRVATILLVMPLYGAIDELTQPWFGRTADAGDWLADVAGAAVALALAELVVSVATRRRFRNGSRARAPAVRSGMDANPPSA